MAWAQVSQANETQIYLAQVDDQETANDEAEEQSSETEDVAEEEVSEVEDSSEAKALSTNEEATSSTTSDATSGTTSDTTNYEDAEVEDVVSTRLKKMDLGGPSPEIVFSGEDIARAGYNSLSDFLRDSPVSSFGSQKESSGLAARAGMASIDLRGLGSGNTLVLINGMRVAPVSGSDAVDTNRIPMAIVKEVKIIKDDLSSIYGSDAMGGVVNIITHDAYDGLTVSGGATVTELGGGERYDISLIGGSSSATTSVFYSLYHRQNDNLYSKDRHWSGGGTSVIGSPGSYMNVGDGTWYTDPTCTDIIDGGAGSEFCNFRHTDYSTTLPSLQQTAAFARLEHKISDYSSFYAEALYNRNRTSYTYAPAPGIFNVPESVASTYGLPNYIPGSDLQVRYRFVELGNRDDHQENSNISITSGFKWDFLDTWTARLAGTYSRERNDGMQFGNGVMANILDLIEAGDFRPFDPAGSRGDVSSAMYQTWSLQVSSFYMADMQIEGELFEILGRPFVLTAGQSYIYREYENKVDEFSKRQEVISGAGSDGFADRTVYSTYAQLTGKLFKGFDLYLSGRYDKYNDFGDTVNPKVGFKYRITDDIMWRGTFGTGFKAPELAILYGAVSESYITFTDRYACDQDGGTGFNCQPQQYRTISGGNPNLSEITSVSYSSGVVYNPSTNLDFSLDFWTVNQEGLPWGASAGGLEDVTRAELAGINPSDYGVMMNRDSNGRLDPSNPISAPTLNIGERQTGGLDFELNWRIPIALGVIKINDSISYRLWDISTTFPGLPDRDYVEERWVNRFRNNLYLGYEINKHNLGFTFISTDKTMNAALNGFVDGWTRVDFAYSYSGFQNASLTLGVQNLLRDDPPIDLTDPNNPVNESLYSQVGPLVYSNFTYHF